jgi:hypothetical protein
MTSIAVTASIRASASEAALLVTSFMPFSLTPGVSHRRAKAQNGWNLLETPHNAYPPSPHLANIDFARVE